VQGEFFTDYPLVVAADGKYSIDATLISPQKGIILFDLIEELDVGEYTIRQDDLANIIDGRLRAHRKLFKRRQLQVPLTVISFAPRINNIEDFEESDYPLVNRSGLAIALDKIKWNETTSELYRITLSAIEGLRSIRKNLAKREIKREDSRGAKLQRLENSIATLDHEQFKAFIKTTEGVQRIRGLAGSGKTIVLALKAAYLHTQHPDWRIAVTFNTRSLKGQFRRLINSFCIEQGGEEADWTKIRIINAWGAPGGDDRDGIFYEYCRTTGTEFFDFRAASIRFGGNENAFDGACQYALKNTSENSYIYDVILIDEAQDFAASFLKLCYFMLKAPNRLIYAYDELQNLSGRSLPPPEEIFGDRSDGQPNVTLKDDLRRDIILQKCYRNSRPVLVTAHSLGFGIYRQAAQGKNIGLVQMFDYPKLWEDIGYQVQDGRLEKGQRLTLERTEETSPKFLEEHSNIDDLIQFRLFSSEIEQNEWLIEQIKKNLDDDELRHDDIVVINPDSLTTNTKTSPIRKKLFDMGIQAHLAGVDTSADIFFRDTPSVTFTGIYRAKGNEAGMVYVINAQDCNGSGVGLASLRNRLFTAITRSKAWVRVIGYGSKMQELVTEFETLKKNNFSLNFIYPDDETLGGLRIVHRDISPHEKNRLKTTNQRLSQFLRDIEDGNVRPEDIDEDTRKRIIKSLEGAKL